jgi:hypothetical protein
MTFWVAHGYSPTTNPKLGDTVLYGGIASETDQIWSGHVGDIIEDDESRGPQVISQYGSGSLVKPALDIIPYMDLPVNFWGDRYCFLSRDASKRALGHTSLIDEIAAIGQATVN